MVPGTNVQHVGVSSKDVVYQFTFTLLYVTMLMCNKTLLSMFGPLHSGRLVATSPNTVAYAAISTVNDNA